MSENDPGAGTIFVILAVGSLAVVILAILLEVRMARRRARGPVATGFTAGASPFVAAFGGAFAGFFGVIFLPWLLAAPALLFAVWAFGVRRRQGIEAGDRALLLGLLAGLWLALAVYGDRMKLWEATVSGPIRVDAVLTAAMAALWAFLGVRLRREAVAPLAARIGGR